MLRNIYVLIFSLTLLLSASLLFVVQPMFSKMILPLLGGTPQVWNTAMLFFQLCLLGGYAYAHGTSRFLGVRAQAILHLALLTLFFFVLPFGIPADWPPPRDSDPTLWQLSVMCATVGGPFFVLSGSAPMLQRWFTLSGHKDADNPYFLYGASNLGSMAALLAYPVLIEPMLDLPTQAAQWRIGYAALAASTLLSALLIWRGASAAPHGTRAAAAQSSERVTWAQRIRWLILSFIPSSLMLGVTVFITTDIATVPLLWVLPLALYVGTFIIVFARKPLLSDKAITMLFSLAVVTLVGTKIVFNFQVLNPFVLIGLHMTTFFLAALMCHTELAKARPSSSHLTEFYLFMSIGGALGGFFNAIIAPQVLVIPIEYGLMLAAAACMRFANDPEQSFAAFTAKLRAEIDRKGLDAFFTLPSICVFVVLAAVFFNFNISHKMLAIGSVAAIVLCLFVLRERRWAFGILIAVMLGAFPFGFYWGQRAFTDVKYQARNFFGVVKVVDMVDGERVLLHGVTNHGAQAQDPKYRLRPLSYYGPNSPVNDAFSYFDRKGGKQNVAIVGLGIGVTACYTQPERHFDFYEIDPEIVEVAENKELFTFLSDCKSPYDIILGDGRMTIAEKPEKNYDFIVMDAFSSDNIPVHLLTLEALSMYLTKLKDDGAIVFNISNNFLDIEPVLAANAEKLGLKGFGKISNGGKIDDTQLKYYPSHWFVMTKSERMAKYLKNNEWSEGIFRDGVSSWTDKFSNVFSVLGNKTGNLRYKAWREKHPEEAAAEETKAVK